MKLKIPFTKATVELADKKPKGSGLTSEVGVAGDVVFNGFKDEEARTDKITIKQYREMLDKDPTVESLFNIFTLPIIAATYRIDADKNDTGEVQAEFVRRNLLEPPHKGGMETPMSLFLDQLLMSVVDGFQLWEKVYRIDEAGRLALKKLAHRDSIGITLKRDKYGGYGGAVQRVNYMGEWKEIELPAYKTFLFTHNKARDFLYGRSSFRSLYPKYDKKRRLEYLDSISLQNDAIKPKVLLRKESGALGKEEKTARNKALAMLAKLGERKPVASLPYGYDIKELNSQGRDPHTSIERQNSEMARAFLATFALLGSQGKESNVGSYALSDNLADMLMISLKAYMTKVEEHINQYLIADLIDLNFPVPHYPEFNFDDITSDTVEVIASAFQELLKKDRISDEMVEGIERATANRLEIDLEKIKKDRKKRAEEEAKEASKSANNESGNDDDNDKNTPSGKQLSDVSSRDFPGLYDGLVDEKKLGCIMLDLQTFDVRKHVENADADLYVTDKAHGSGAVAESEAHVTLLYGLLQNGNTIKDKVDKVLEGLNIESVVINDVGSFEVASDAPSVPIVAFVSSGGGRDRYIGDDELRLAHDRLSLLPHVNTFGNYQPHVTLAYVKNDPDIVHKWVTALGEKLRGMRIGVTGLNYGDLPEDDDEGSSAGNSGGKFLSDGQRWWRPLTPAEQTVRLADIEKRMDNMEDEFIGRVEPVLKSYLESLTNSEVESGNVGVELPKDYIAAVSGTIRTAYNYAKTGAADELKVAAPATSKEAIESMKQLTDFVINKQQDDLKNILIAEKLKHQRLTRSLAEGEEEEDPNTIFKTSLQAAFTAWLARILRATASSIVATSVANGRGDVFDDVAGKDDLFQLSGILDEKICPMCEELDGSVVTRDEYRRTRWKPPFHFNCRCLWILVRKVSPDYKMPEVTGLPLMAGGEHGPKI